MMIHFTKVVRSESSKARWIGKVHARERCNEKFENPEMKSGAEEMPPGSTAATVEAQLSVVEMMLSSSLLPALRKGHRYLARGSRFLCKLLTAI